MKSDFSALIANDGLCDHFSSAVRSGSLSHAYILLGASGTGKHTLALEIAAALNCEEKSHKGSPIPCRRCASCRRIFSRDCADVIYVSREKDRATLGIESVRFIKNDVSVYPNDGDHKIYIIEDAHTMTVQAQNALLLTLEEPPPYVIFLLLCENSEDILETIRSRAPIMRMRTPTRDEAMTYLKTSSPTVRTLINTSPSEFDDIYMASGGSLGRIISLAGSSERKSVLQSRRLTQRLIEATAHKTLSNDIADILSELSQKRDERERLTSQLTELQTALRDLLVIKKADEAPLVFFSDRSYAEELSYSFSAKRLSDIIEEAERAKLALAKNANIKLTVTSFLADLI